MPSKVHLLNRRYEIDLEAENNAELESLLEMLEERKIAPWVAPGAAAPAVAIVATAHPAGGSDTPAPLGTFEALPANATAPLDAFGGESPAVAAASGGSVSADDPALKALRWNPKDNLFTLAGVLPDEPGGPNRSEEAALMLLMGYASRGEDEVTGTRLMAALERSGVPVSRVDRLLEPAVRARIVIPSGVRKGRRYRLSVPGVERARKAAVELLSHLPSSAAAPPPGEVQ